MVVETILFNRRLWTIPLAESWLRRHKYKYGKVDITTNFFRFRQRTPKRGAHYYTVKLPNGIHLVNME